MFAMKSPKPGKGTGRIRVTGSAVEALEAAAVDLDDAASRMKDPGCGDAQGMGYAASAGGRGPGAATVRRATPTMSNSIV